MFDHDEPMMLSVYCSVNLGKETNISLIKDLWRRQHTDQAEMMFWWSCFTAMSDQVVIKEEHDCQVPTEDETDASSRSEVSEDETDWESIVESRSERDTKKRKSKTKAKEGKII